jgi:hypothetical protein
MHVLPALALLLSLLATGGHAQTRLTVPAPNWCLHEGRSVWEANRPAQNALARITLELACNEGAVVSVRVKTDTRCGRVLCTWSYAEEAQVDGTAIQAVFFTFTATRLMTIQLSGDQIGVIVENDYNQPGRETDTMQAMLWLDS